jgi:ABC-type branched-subunit amino acid transport system substrate-binding protein
LFPITAAVAAISLAACGSPASANASGGKDPAKITIGATLTLTGASAPYGQAMLQGMRLAADAYNAAGGINGKTKVEIQSYDTQGSPTSCLQGANQMISQYHATAIATMYATCPLAQLPAVTKASTVLVNGGGGDASLLNQPWLFNALATDPQEAYATMSYAYKNLGVKSLVILAENDVTTLDISDVAAVWKSISGKAPKVISVSATATDVQPQVQQALADHPGAIFTRADGETENLLIAQLAQQHAKQKILVQYAGVALTSVLNSPLASQIYASLYQLTPNADYRAQLAAHKLSTTSPNAYTSIYYTIVRMIGSGVQSLERQGKAVNGTNLKAFFDSGRSMVGCCGKTSFTRSHSISGELGIGTITHGVVHQVATVKLPAQLP